MKSAIRMFLTVILAASFTPVFADSGSDEPNAKESDTSTTSSSMPADAKASQEASEPTGAASGEPRDLVASDPGHDAWVMSIWEPQP